ncbi:HEAT repeat domain-containing protein [Planctomycetota bacterium]
MDRNKNSLNEHNFEKIVRRVESVKRPDEFADDVEQLIRDLTRVKYGAKKKTVWNNIFNIHKLASIAAVLLLVAGIFLLCHQFVKNADIQYNPITNNPPRQPELIPVKFMSSDGFSMEAPCSLMEIINDSNLIIAGKIRTTTDKEKDLGDFICIVDSVLKGELLGTDVDYRQKEVTCCLASPNYVPAAWVVLFVSNGNVASDQRKVEFRNYSNFLQFCKRVTAYRDKSIIPTLADELVSDESKFPFSDKNRIFTDLSIFKSKKSVPGLIHYAYKNKGHTYNHMTVSLIREIGNKCAVEFLKEVFEKEGWTKSSKYTAIIGLAKLDEDYIDDKIVSCITDTTKPINIRGACMLAAAMVKHVKTYDPIVKILDNEKHKNLHQYALKSLGELGDKRAVPRLIEILENGGDQGHYPGNAAFALGKIGDPSVLVLLRKALDRNSSSYTTDLIRQAIAMLEGTNAILLPIDMWDCSLEQWLQFDETAACKITICITIFFDPADKDDNKNNINKFKNLQPQMKFSIDSKLIEAWNIELGDAENTDYTEYSAEVEVAAGTHQINIDLFNNWFQPDTDEDFGDADVEYSVVNFSWIRIENLTGFNCAKIIPKPDQQE